MSQSIDSIGCGNDGLTRLRLIKYYDRYYNISVDGKLEVYASVKACDTADNVGITIFLQRFDGDWTTIKKWDKESENFYCSIHDCVDAETELDYRIEVFYSASYGECVEEMVSVQE